MIAGLGDDLGFLGQLAKFARLGDGVRHRLFAIDVLSRFERPFDNRRMPVIRRCDDHGVQRRFFVEEFAVILVGAGVFYHVAIVFLGGLGSGQIHIAERDRVVPHSQQVGNVTLYLAAHADKGDVQFFVGVLAKGPGRKDQWRGQGATGG